MKSFTKQFSECVKNNTAEILNTKEVEVIKFRPNLKGIYSMKVTKVYFCNKYMKRCSSKICLKERSK